MASATRNNGRFERRGIDDVIVDDERSFVDLPLYRALKDVLRAERTTFRILPRSHAARWDRALFLNLTYWGVDGGGDVLTRARIPADVVTHVAWHALAARAFPSRRGHKPSASSMFMGEAIASGFDAYWMGMLLVNAPGSDTLATQVEAMAETARAAGTSARAFEKLLRRIAADPAGSFELLRQLLFNASTALYTCKNADAAAAALDAFDAHPFAPLLHRHELATWVLYARAYGASRHDARVTSLHQQLQRAPSSLALLQERWLASP